MQSNIKSEMMVGWLDVLKSEIKDKQRNIEGKIMLEDWVS